MTSEDVGAWLDGNLPPLLEDLGDGPLDYAERVLGMLRLEADGGALGKYTRAQIAMAVGGNEVWIAFGAPSGVVVSVHDAAVPVGVDMRAPALRRAGILPPRAPTSFFERSSLSVDTVYGLVVPVMTPSSYQRVVTSCSDGGVVALMDAALFPLELEAMPCSLERLWHLPAARHEGMAGVGVVFSAEGVDPRIPPELGGRSVSVGEGVGGLSRVGL